MPRATYACKNVSTSHPLETMVGSPPRAFRCDRSLIAISSYTWNEFSKFLFAKIHWLTFDCKFWTDFVVIYYVSYNLGKVIFVGDWSCMVLFFWVESLLAEPEDLIDGLAIAEPLAEPGREPMVGLAEILGIEDCCQFTNVQSPGCFRSKLGGGCQELRGEKRR